MFESVESKFDFAEIFPKDHLDQLSSLLTELITLKNKKSSRFMYILAKHTNGSEQKCNLRDVNCSSSDYMKI